MGELKITGFIAALLLVLTGCSGDKSSDGAFIKFSTSHGSVYDNCYVTLSERKLTYCDLDTGESTPVCSVPGCKHDGSSENCTARIKDEFLSYPFRYGGKLYYFGLGADNSSRLYSCEENGTLRETVLVFERYGDEEEYVSPMVYGVQMYEDKLYILLMESVLAKTKYGYSTNGMTNYKIGCYDLRDGSYSVLYETGIYFDCYMQLYGVYNDTIYAHFSGNTKEYEFETVEDRIAAVQDENSDYNRTKFRKTLKISAADGGVSESDSQMEWYVTSPAGCWYMLGNSLYTADGTYIAEAYSMYAAEDGLIYYDYDKENVYLYNNGVVKSAPYSQSIYFESRDYYVCDYSNETNTYYYCTKESYFSGAPEFRELEMKQ
ncbi:MAG: hypothetical protein IJ784_03000 [Ruminiclostridium sp.]|nr:hypothetical protein [Ruminiclostridium sp.]